MPCNPFFVSEPGLAQEVVSSDAGYCMIYFEASDFALHNPKYICTIPAGKFIDRVELRVIEAFDTGGVEVGPSFAHAELQQLLQNFLQHEFHYISEPDIAYATPTDVYLWFIATSGLPKIGYGRVLIYYQ